MTITAIESLRWQRLSAELVNIRSSPAKKAPPVAIFQSIVKGINIQMGEGEESPVFFHLRDKSHTFAMRQGDRVTLDVFFCRRDESFAKEWRERFIACLASPETGKNFDIVGIGGGEERSLAAVVAEAGPLPEDGELCLEFLTPLPFRQEKGKPRTHFSLRALTGSIRQAASVE
ncbi:MAG: hypothetical protein WA140_11050, partial [Geobacteraceae bacterium]